MGYQYHNGERAELANGTTREERNDAQHRIVRHDFQCVRGARLTQSLGDTLLDRYRYRCSQNSVNLKQYLISCIDVPNVQRTMWNMFSTPINITMIGNNSL